MSKCAAKIYDETLAVATTNLDAMDVSMYNGVSVQINGIVGTAGSLKLQQSNDGVNWEDIASATVTLAASVPKILTVAGIYTNLVRPVVTLSGGAGQYKILMLAKER